MEERQRIQKEQWQDNLEDLRSKMDRKTENLVLERIMQMERMENNLALELENEKNKVLKTLDKQNNEEMLASEISRMKREETRDMKIREHLRESSEEIKVLENKLRAAYVNKQLLTQMAEKEAAVAQEKLEVLKIQEMMEGENRCMEEKTRLSENTLNANKLQYREELLNQIKEGNKNEQVRQRDLILEKALLEQTMRKISEEDEKERVARIERLNNMKNEMLEFQRQKEIQKHNEKLAREAEEANIKAYAEEKEKQEQKRAQYLKDKEIMKSNIVGQMTDLSASKFQSRKEREDILAELADEELRNRDIKNDKEKADAVKKLKEDFQNFYKKHLEEKEEAWRTDFKEQKEYRNKLLDDIAKQEREEKSSSGNVAIKKKELRESLLNQMKDKHKRQIEEWQRDSAQEKLREIEEEERARLLEEERLRILRFHSPRLTGFLPRGVHYDHGVNSLEAEPVVRLCERNATS